MRKTRRAAFAAAMLCYLAGAFLLFGVYEGPMDAMAVQDATPGEDVRVMGDVVHVEDARLTEWQDSGHMMGLRTLAPVDIIVRSDAPLPEGGRWVVHGILEARILLDGRPTLLIDANDVTAPLLLG